MERRLANNLTETDAVDVQKMLLDKPFTAEEDRKIDTLSKGDTCVVISFFVIAVMTIICVLVTIFTDNK